MTASRTAGLATRVSALSPGQRQALSEAIARAAPDTGPAQLVGYLVPAAPGRLTEEELRDFLEARLPAPMIPTRFVVLGELPRLASGKLDRRGLRSTSGDSLDRRGMPAAETAPWTPVELQLAAIWQAVLKLEVVGLDDDFFEVGGDSLLSIRVIARAAREGLTLSPELFFANPTIRHLAAGVQSVAGTDRSATVAPTGEAPLTPIQHWFFERVSGQRDRWNQAYLLTLGHPLPTEAVHAAVKLLVGHHGALRLRMARQSGGWVQDFLPAGDDIPYRVVDLAYTPAAEYGDRVRAECEREQDAIRIEEGGLFRCVDFVGEGGWRRLLLVGHHLVLDGVSWHVILDDLAALVIQASAGTALSLPAPTTSARAWSLGLVSRSAAPDIGRAAGHWIDQLPGPEGTGPVEGGINRDAATLTLEVDPTVSHRLLRDAPQRLDVGVPTLLLSAFLLAWQEWSGQPELHLDVEGHGRDILGDGFDVSRTVGWFTTVFPMRLAATRKPATGADVTSVVRLVQGVLDALPLRGAAHGMARYLAPPAAFQEALAARSHPRILFNHLGTLDPSLPPASRLTVAEEGLGPLRHPDAARPYELEVNSRVVSGQLVVTIEYPTQKHPASEMARLADGFRGAMELVGGGAAPVRSGLVTLDSATVDVVGALLRDLDQA